MTSSERTRKEKRKEITKTADRTSKREVRRALWEMSSGESRGKSAEREERRGK